MKPMRMTSDQDTSRHEEMGQRGRSRALILSIVTLGLLSFLLVEDGSSRRTHADVPATPVSDLVLTLRRLESSDAVTRELARVRLEKDRETIVRALKVLLQVKENEPNARDIKLKVVALLSEYRDSDAADALVDIVTFGPPIVAGEPHPLDRYPAAMALVKIGNPAAYRAILRRLGGADLSEKELKLFAWIVRYIDGDDERAPVGLFRLEHELKLCRLNRQNREAARGMPLPPGRFERDLERLIAVYKLIDDDSGPENWP